MLRYLVAKRLAHSITRNPAFAQVSTADLDFFTKILSRSAVLSTELGDTVDDLQPYNVDWMRKYHGNSTVVLKPRTTQQVSQILKHCNSRNIAVVPQGGNTGLVGGGVPVFDEVVINLQQMTDILKFDGVSGSVVCQAGVILEKLDNYLGQRGHMMPLDLGAKGSCQIGGNIATNAGGLRLLRYGSLHGTVLGLEVVLADGTILDNLSTLRKDNTGYDLKQLFIGSEGTLGIITAASILTPIKPQAVNVSILGLESFEHVQKVFAKTKNHLGEILSAFEFWDGASLSMVREHLQVRDPLSSHTPFYVLLETSGSNKEHDDDKMSSFLEHLIESGDVVDGVLAQDSNQAQGMWAIREGIPEACSKSGAVYKYDISMPVPVLYKLVQDMTQRLRDQGLYNGPLDDGLWAPSADSIVNGVVGYGHVGDGNLHLNVSAKEFSTKVTECIEPFVYEWAQSYGGSISAEHGLGLMKSPYVQYSKSAPMIDYMHRIKHVFDPKGVLNPYKYLPDAGAETSKTGSVEVN